MEDENKKFSFTNLLIKAIIVIIFILFTAWLISLSHKGINNSLDVLTDQIFAENLAKMKEVGKEYFTTERLPQKVGEVKTLTLAKMYDSKYILELKDKYGNYCSAANSYVSVEKFDNEYQMKVYLECGDHSDYIISIMGCYDYCSSTICEKKDTPEIKGNDSEPTKNYQYEYKRYTGGRWTDYGEWSEWSRTSITSTNYRQVETKTEKEEYTYNKEVWKTDYKEFSLVCPAGFKPTEDGTKCYMTSTENVVLYSQPTCPSTYDGGTFTSRDGFTCYYTKAEQKTVDPTCPSTYDGGTLTGRNGFTCSYSKTISTPYTYTVIIPKTCYSQQLVKSCSTCAPTWQNVPYDCSYPETRIGYKNETTTITGTASCPTGYNKSGNMCVTSGNKNITTTATCESGYTPTKDKTTCYKNSTTTKVIYGDYNKTCPAGYDKTSDNTKCYRNYTEVVTVTETRDVIYYRYRVREYVDGTVDYKWSYSKNDKSLLDAGYTLTGNVRETK